VAILRLLVDLHGGCKRVVVAAAASRESLAQRLLQLQRHLSHQRQQARRRGRLRALLRWPPLRLRMLLLLLLLRRLLRQRHLHLRV